MRVPEGYPHLKAAAVEEISNRRGGRVTIFSQGDNRQKKKGCWYYWEIFLSKTSKS